MAKCLPEELIQCLICLGELKIPRTLPCLHTFCESCLENHIKLSIQKQRRGVLKIKIEPNHFPCATCREPTPNPVKGVKGFPKDFRVMKLIDMQKHFLDLHHIHYCEACSDGDSTSTADSFCVDCERYFCQTCSTRHRQKLVLASHIFISLPTNSSNNQQKCTKHPNEYVKYFCKSCDHDICIKCVLCDHGNHDILNSDASCSDERLTLRNSVQHINHQIWCLHDVLFNLTCIEGKVKGKYEETKLNVKKHSRKMINIINSEEFKFLSDIDDVYHQHTGELYRRREQCQKYLQKFKGFKTKLESILRVSGTNQVIENYMEVLKEIQKVEITEDYRISMLSFPNFVNFTPGCISRFGSLHQNIGDIHNFSKLDLSRHNNLFPSERSSFGAKNTNNSGTYQHKMQQNKDGHLSDMNTGSFNISDVLDDTEMVEYRPQADTSYNSNRLSPYPTIQSSTSHDKSLVPCVKLLCQIGGFGRNAGQLCLPYGVTFTKDDRVAIAENGNRQIQIFDINGKSQCIISTGNGIPRGIATTEDGHFVITDEYTKSVIVMTEKGNRISTAKPRVSFPFGVVVMPNGKVAVTDMIHENISIISLDGEKISQFGCHGNSFRNLDNPSYLATDKDSNIVVSDSGHHEIKVFTIQGRLLHQFGGYGSGDGQMKYPKGVVVDKNGLIIVADSGNDRVVAFSKEGIYQGALLDKNYGIDRPTGLAYSCSGLLAVSMPDAHEVYIYELSASIPSMLRKMSF